MNIVKCVFDCDYNCSLLCPCPKCHVIDHSEVINMSDRSGVVAAFNNLFDKMAEKKRIFMDDIIPLKLTIADQESFGNFLVSKKYFAVNSVLLYEGKE